MALLTQIVITSQRVSATASRLEKTRELAACLRAVGPDEVAVAIAWLSGETCQGKRGVSYASLQPARVAPAPSPTLQLLEVDRVFAGPTQVQGKGAGAKRADALRALFSRATAEAQDFLVRLIVGELRQGALRGLMLEAITAAAQVPAADVRRAAMSAGGLAEVARAAPPKAHA